MAHPPSRKTGRLAFVFPQHRSLSVHSLIRYTGQITFGKYCRSHPCNVREFKIYAGQTPDMKTMSLVHWGGLKNDAIAETFELSYKNSEDIILPCEYVCIEPISAHSSNYNVSIW